tara:strand:- start:16342 stop:17814 length:1473 start_codon:yes stop_codon:yes gene_type:complete
MKYINTLLFALGITTASYAQITIDSADFGQIGDNVIMVSDSSVYGKTVAAASNVAQTFDYTSMSFEATSNYQFLNPTGTIAGNAFPAANLAIAMGANMYYTIKSANAVIVDGVYGDLYNVGTNAPLNFNPNVTMMSFPTTFNTTGTTTRVFDTVLVDTVTGLFDSLRLKSTTIITRHADAFGTLVLPNVSETVIRMYDVEVTRDSVWGKIFGNWTSVQQSNATQYFYRFMAKNRSYYMLEAETDPSGTVTAVSYQTGNSLFAGISTKQRTSCYGSADGSATVLAVGGTAPYSYLWSNGATTNVATNLAAGNYNVSVTDNTGVMYTVQTVISQPDSISITATQIGPDHGLTNGFVHIETTGGTPSYRYVWSNGETTKNIDNLTFGTYTVTATDNKGCTGTGSFVVDDITSVKEVRESAKIAVYPNPSTGFVIVESTSKWELVIFDLSGKTLKKAQGNGRQTVDLSKLNSGFYGILITVDGELFQSKFSLVK